MWHEAKKQEKKIREVMVDFQRRAERRREHYDKLIKLKGILIPPCQIPWQGDPDNLISRYDVRMHMDIIPDYSKLPEVESSWEEKFEENKINYERYRSMIMNEFNNVPESDALAKIEVEEMFSDVKKPHGKKKTSKNKATIGYNYDQGSSKEREEKPDELSDESDYEMDFDVDVLSTRQIDKLNVTALNYGVTQGHFTKSLRSEKTFLMERKQAKLAEMERSAFSGKKARKERRLYKEIALKSRPYSPPFYASTAAGSEYHRIEENESPKSGSSSRSVSPEGKMEFITEFGGGGGDSQFPPDSSHVTSHVTSGSRHKKKKDKAPPTHRKSRWDRSRSRSRERHRERSRSRERRDSTSKHGRRSRSRSSSSDRVSAIAKSKLEAKKSVSKKPATPILPKQEKAKLTPQERLKRRMQLQLSKTFKEDKKTEREKAEVKEVERIEREEKLKEETFKLRQRERQRLGLEGSPPTTRSRSPSPLYYRY